MSEFDFDEIDKAVTSAMGGTTETAVPTVPAIVNAPAEPAPAPSPTSSEGDFSIPVKKPVPPALRRSTGRIMDVMPRTAVKPNVQVDAQKSVINAPSPVEEKPSDIDLAPTPFLPNANEKIEKRPLGSGAEVNSPSVENTATAQPYVAPELGTIDQPIGVDSPIPAELNNDILSIESAAETTESSSSSEPEPEEIVSVESPSVQDPTPEPVPEQPVPDVAPSIVQQYQEKQSSSAEQPGAIYDTQDYHKPLKEPTKKSPVLFIILWVFGLIVVGAAAGWAVYTFVLPHL